MIENIQSHSADEYEEAPQPKRKRRKNPLDNEANKKLHGKLMDWWIQARDHESSNRIEQALDADFKDGLQWSQEDADELRSRGQAPLVYNKIKPAIDWVLGTEKRSRMDFAVYARRSEDTDVAETKTSVLKYLSDVNKTPFHRSRAFDDAVTVGVGWLEDGVRGDSTDDPLFSRYESWRNIWYDPLSVERDMSDARFIFRSKFIDLDIAKAMFPDRKRTLDSAAKASSFYGDVDSEEDTVATYYGREGFAGGLLYQAGKGYASSEPNRQRERVRLIECWYREPTPVRVVRGEMFHGAEYEDDNDEMNEAIENEYASVYDAIVMKVNLCIMTEDALLFKDASPYRHNEFPFTPIWAYRRGRDNSPYGIVRNIRDPQENLNKRMSKALHILSSNQIIAEEDAATDWDEIRDEAARPDGILLLDGRKDARFELVNDKALAQQHVNLMEIDARMIQDVSGVTDENLGKPSNATSGRAVTARQEQGSVLTSELFDNLRYAFQLQGEKQLSLIEQYYDHTKVIRIVGDNGQPEYLNVNQPEIDPITGQLRIMNDITSTKGDFIVDESEYRATQRRAMFDMFAELLKTMDPETSMQLLDLMFEYSDLPGREEIVSRIRKLNGQSDPKKQNDPEEIQRMEQQAQEEQMMKEFERRRIELEIEKLQADVSKTLADVEKVKADAVNTNVNSLYTSIQTGTEIALTPTSAMLGDTVATSAGFIDKNPPPLFNAPDKPVLPPMSRQERTIIQKKAGLDSDNDGNPLTADKASDLKLREAQSKAAAKPVPTGKTGGTGRSKGVLKKGSTAQQK